MLKIQEIRALQACEEKGIINPVIEIVHAEMPKTIINGKEYRLVFPKWIVTAFDIDRDIEISFEGVVTPNRKMFLDRLYKTYEGIHYPIMIYSSTRGRQEKTKKMDYQYFKTLHRSKFVACPSGDFIWSYRFFEAILCGAIPIAEDKSPLYEGYMFYRVGDKLTYHEDWAIYNLKRLKKQMML